MPASAKSHSGWACPDTGLRWFTYADSSDTDRPWHPPSHLEHNPKSMPEILPGMYLNYQYKDQDGRLRVGGKEIIEPTLSWVEDLNGDGRADMAIHDGVMETRPTWVLLNCDRDRYIVAFESMAEGVAVETPPDRNSKWKALRVHWWYFQGEQQQNMILHWNGAGFAKVCEYQVHADSLNNPRRTGCP